MKGMIPRYWEKIPLLAPSGGIKQGNDMASNRMGRDIPTTWWSSTDMHSIRPSGSTLSILVLGLFLFGLGDAVIISADWGVTPWTVLADGISFMMGTSIGTATFLVSLVVLLLWIPLRERPGVGTILNVLIIAGTIEIFEPHLGISPSATNSLFRIVVGTTLIAVGSALTRGTVPRRSSQQ